MKASSNAQLQTKYYLSELMQVPMMNLSSVACMLFCF